MVKAGSLQQVVQLAKSVGQFIYQEGQHFSMDKVAYKGKNDMVSYVDKTAEEKIVKGLREILPEAGFITEEGTASNEGEQYKWIIDPLDGTTNFTHRLPVYSVSIALLDGEELVMGVIYDPNRSESFYAEKGQPAYCNGTEIKVSGQKALEDSLIATGFPYNEFEKMDEYFHIMRDFMKNTHGLRRMGSAAIDLAYVACGRFEGFFEYNLKPWDMAAGIHIIQQAGGLVTDFAGGNDYLFGKQVVTGCDVQPAMLDMIRKHW